MKKPLLLFLFFLFTAACWAQTLTTSVSGAGFCAGSTVSVSYSDAVTTYLPGNEFSAQLSDASGSFALPVTIGQITSAASSGTIAAVLPAGTSAGTGYRIRVVSTDPVLVGNDNGADISVNAIPNTPIISVTSPVCAGQPLSLTVTNPTPGASYAWTMPGGAVYTGPPTSFITIPASVAATHSGPWTVVTSAGSCSSLPGSVSVAVNVAPPTPQASSNSLVCAGDTLQLFAAGPATASYVWTKNGVQMSNQQNPVFPVATASMSGTWTVTATEAGCSSASAILQVTVNPVPVPAITPAGPLTVPPGSTMQLTANLGPFSYSWSSGDTTPIITVGPGCYSVTVTANNCSATSSPVCVSSSIPVSAYNNSPVCAGQPVQLFVTPDPSGIYTWTDPSGATIGASQNITVTPTTSGTYTVAVGPGGIVGTATTTVTINPADDATFSYGSSTFCQTGIDPVPATPFTGVFTHSPSGLDLDPVTGEIDLSNSSIGTYNVTFTTNGFCPATSSQIVNIVSTADAAFSYQNTTYCQSASDPAPVFPPGASAGIFSAHSGVVINPASGVIDLSASAPGTFWVYNSIAASGGCAAAADSTEITILAAPAPPAIVSNPVCIGADLHLSILNFDPAVTYNWSGPVVFTSSSADTIISNATAGLSGMYTVVADNGICSSSAITQVIVSPVPAAPMASSNSPVCTGGSLQLTAAGSIPGASYSWIYPDGGTSTAQNPVRYDAQPSMSGLYSVSIAANGCSSAATTIQVDVVPPPAPPTIYSFPICQGEPLQLSTIFVPGASYTWIAPNTNLLIGQIITITNAQPSDSGLYTLITPGALGCATPMATYNVIVYSSPPVPAVFTNSPVCVGETLTLSTGSVPGVTYEWTSPSGQTYSGQTISIPNATAALNGTFSVRIISASGCMSTIGTGNVDIVNSIPIQITSNNQICPGNTLSLTAASASLEPYTWTGPNNFSATGSVVTVPNLTGAGYGTYSVTSTGGSSCIYSGTIVIDPLSAPDISGVTSYCSGDVISLSASSNDAVSYSWSGPGGFSSNQQIINIPNAGATNSGAYSVTAGFGGCSSVAATVQITVAPAPVITASANNPVSPGSTLFLTVNGPAGVYNWTGPQGFTATGTSPYIQNMTPAKAGNYTVTMQDCGNATDVVNVLITGLSQITGVVFDDANNNGVKDAGEMPVPNAIVELDTGLVYAMTNSAGLYSFTLFPGTYTIVYDATNGNEVVSPAGHTVTVGAGQQIITGKDFAVHTVPGLNVQTLIASSMPPSPGFLRSYSIYVFNPGNVPASGLLKFVPDSVLLFNYASSGYTTSGDTLIWSYTNLLPGMSYVRSYNATTPIGTPHGTLLTFTAIATPITGDVVPANNIFTLPQIVVGSYDPNDKQVLPAGDITPMQVAAGQNLNYKIRFQNTGTYHAEFVLLVDTISDNLDLGSFRMLSASHNYQLSIRDGRVLEWYFPNIMLPDSNTNEPESHGYVQYQIKPVSTLGIGDEIENTAYIYFDFNEAVITNTTSTMINLVSAPEGLQASNNMLLYPNPNNGSFTIELEDCKPGIINIKLTNLLGQEVYTEAASAKNSAFTHQLNVPHLPDGVYLLQVMQGEKMMVKRVVKQR